MTTSTIGLYNTNQGNTGFYNGQYGDNSLPISDEQISYNGYGLQNSQIITSYEESEKAPERELRDVARPQAHGMINNSTYWRRKEIVLRGMLSCNTSAELETLIDTLKEKLSPTGKNLDIRRNGTIRRFITTAEGINIKRNEHYWISSCPFEISFECLTPFGESTNYTAESYWVGELGADDKGRSFTQIIENDGTAYSEPYIIMVMRAISSITVLNFKNDTTGEEMEITKTLNVGDVVILNAEEKTVTVNGIETDFLGTFPDLLAGANIYTITMTGTGCEYYLTAKTKAKWL